MHIGARCKAPGRRWRQRRRALAQPGLQLAAEPGLPLNPKAAMFAAPCTATACRLEAERRSPGGDVAGSRGLSHLCFTACAWCTEWAASCFGGLSAAKTPRDLQPRRLQDQLCAEELSPSPRSECGARIYSAREAALGRSGRLHGVSRTLDLAMAQRRRMSTSRALLCHHQQRPATAGGALTAAVTQWSR